MFIVERKPESVSAEAYRSLRSNIQYCSFDKECKTLVITSSEPGEGKSTTAGNLALILSKGENKVLLVDCDMRKPTIHKRFKISNNIGLSDLLIGKKDVYQVAHAYSDKLSIVTSGKVPPNPSEMLASKSMQVFIEKMREQFDYVVLDTPPVQVVTDAQVLSTKVDGVILVIRANQTKRDVVSNSVNTIRKVNGNIIGTVLNGIDNISNKYYNSYTQE